MELLDQNISAIFEGAADFNRRELRCGDQTLYLYSIDGLVSGGDISNYVVKPVTQQLKGGSVDALYEGALRGMIYNAVAVPCTDVRDAALKLVNGFCVVLFPKAGAIAFEVKTGEKRSISGPDLENTAKGPKDSFVETVRTNTGLIRRHLRTPDLRLHEMKVGCRSLTNVSIVWIDGITNPEYVQRMIRRLSDINIDGMLTPAAVEEYVTGSRMTPFPLLQYTQRTDRFCQSLLDGRVGLLVDGIPLGYLAPVDVGYLMNSPEDLGRDFMTASFVRILRYLALAFDLLMPALYVAFTVHHWELMPSAMGQVILQGREKVPFSPVWEILVLLIAFELLQESGIHLPQNIGQSVSIIGGIVVGTAGVEAGLISSIALITVSVAGICGFVLPNRDLASTVRLCRFFLAVMAAVGGLFGVGVGIALLLIHLAGLKSLGVSYIVPVESKLIRGRLVNEKLRSKKLNTKDRKKQR